MNKLNWLEKRDMGDGLIQVFIYPHFFDFSKTSYPDGIPVFNNANAFLHEDDDFDIDDLMEKAEAYLKDNIGSTIEYANEENQKPVEYLSKEFRGNPENFFIYVYTDFDFELMKTFYYPRLILPFVNGEDRGFSHGIGIQGERNYNADGHEEKHTELNKLLFEITQKHLSLI